MKNFIELSTANIVVGYKTVKDNIINTNEDGTVNLFSDLDNHFEAAENVTVEVMGNKYNPDDESYTGPGVDSEGNPRWFNVADGTLWQNTYEEDGRVSIPEQVTE
jgi:hypothetical protein|tara:strand:+ start:14036 stop:14350 length:315 start_codon:yes stop_codon:yes gene_type:complete